MTSKKLYNSIPKYMKQQLDATRTVIFLLGLAYLVIGPIFLIFQMSLYKDSMRVLPMLEVLFNTYYVPYYIIGIIFATTGAFMITRYQNVAKQSDFYHSLPVSRSRLLAAKIFAMVLVQALFLLVCVVAVVVAGIIYAIRNGSMDLVVPMLQSALLQYVYIMLAFLLAMAVALFAGQLTASTLGQVLMTLVMHITFPLFGTCCDAALGLFSQTYFHGGWPQRIMGFHILNPYLENSLAIKNQIDALNPMMITDRLSEVFNIQLLIWPLFQIILYVALTVVLFSLTFKLYQHRAVEKAGDTLMYNWVGSIVKAVYVYLGAFVGGVVFYGMAGNHFWGFVLGAIIASLVVHIIAEMIYSQDINGIFKHRLSTVLALATTLGVSFCLYNGIIDYDTMLPRASAVEAATIQYNDGPEIDMEADADHIGFTKPDYIKKVLTAMEQADASAMAMDEAAFEDEADIPDTRTLVVSYSTKFGGDSKRIYDIPLEDAVKIMAPFLDDSTYHQLLWEPLLESKPADISYMNLNANSFANVFGGRAICLIDHREVGDWEEDVPMPRMIETPEQEGRAEALLEAIQKDIPKRNKDILASRCLGTVEIEMATTYNDMNYTIYEGDQATNALLKKWRAEDFLPEDEAAQYEEALQNIDIQAMHYTDTPWSYEAKAAIAVEDFVAQWMNGDLIFAEQAERCGIAVEPSKGVVMRGQPTINQDTTDTTYAIFLYRAGVGEK